MRTELARTARRGRPHGSLPASLLVSFLVPFLVPFLVTFLIPFLTLGCSEDDPLAPRDGLLALPLGLTVEQVGISSVTLRWTHSDPAVVSYEIQARAESGPFETRGANVRATRRSMTSEVVSLTDRTNYAFRVRALGLNRASAWSNIVGARTKVGAPTRLRALPATLQSVALTWEFRLPDPTRFELERRVLPDDWEAVISGPEPSDRHFFDTEVTHSIDYEYRMRAVEGGDVSPWSSIARTRPGDPDDPDDPDPDDPIGGIAGTLQRLRSAYASRNPEFLKGFFADDFSFEFSPADPILDPTTPLRWGRADEEEATRRILTGADVVELALDFTAGPVLLPDDDDPVPSSARKIYLEGVNLRVVRATINGQIHLRALEDRAELFLRETEAASGSGERLWEVFLWRDLAIDNEVATWGTIKRAFNPVVRVAPDWRLGMGPGIVTNPQIEDPCGVVTRPIDGPYDSAIAWGFDGAGAGEIGAFAQRFTGAAEVCAVILDLSSTHGTSMATLDLIVWQDVDGKPGRALCILPDVTVQNVAAWPDVSRHQLPLGGCCVEGAWWAGFRGTWPGASPKFYIAASETRSASATPSTWMAPGLGPYTGWRPVGETWPEARTLGLAVETRVCEE